MEHRVRCTKFSGGLASKIIMYNKIIIIGGGLAGLTAALHLSKEGFSVLVIEKKAYPQHKVCGEYVSDEVQTYLQYLGADIKSIQPNHVDRFRLYAPSGTFIEALLPLGGFGMRRYTLDHHLYEKALAAGVDFWLNTKVEQVHFREDHFEVYAQRQPAVKAKVVLGSFGKRSTLDKALSRPFFQQPADYLGVKFYLKADFPSNLVSLYNFAGGYGGAVEVEDSTVDIAYLTRHDQVKACGGLQPFEEKVIWQNPAFKTLLTESERLKPTLTISNISFRPKRQIQDHILMLGDAAGMIPPLAGNGMAMAIHAGKLASESVTDFLKQRSSRRQMEQQYQKAWNRHFAYRLYWGRRLHRFMGKPGLSEFSVRALQRMPFLLPAIVRQTHGEVIESPDF